MLGTLPQTSAHSTRKDKREEAFSQAPYDYGASRKELIGDSESTVTESLQQRCAIGLSVMMGGPLSPPSIRTATATCASGALEAWQVPPRN